MIMAEWSSDTGRYWSDYDTCPRCHAAAGEPCRVTVWPRGIAGPPEFQGEASSAHRARVVLHPDNPTVHERRATAAAERARVIRQRLESGEPPCRDCGSPPGESCITSGGRPRERHNPSGDLEPLLNPVTQVAAALLAGRRLTDEQEAVYGRYRRAVDAIIEIERHA